MTTPTKTLAERQVIATTARTALNQMREGLRLLEKTALNDGRRGSLVAWYSLAHLRDYLYGLGSKDVAQWVGELESEAKDDIP